nr:C939 [uncultured bacterium]
MIGVAGCAGDVNVWRWVDPAVQAVGARRSGGPGSGIISCT